MKKRLLALLMTLALLLSGCALEFEVPPETLPEGGGTLRVHFIDVGQADSALIECDEEFLLIDGGNRADGQLLISYLQDYGVESLTAVIGSHAHEDHMGGLPSVLAVYPTQAVYAPTRTHASRFFDDVVYYTDQQGLEITVPQPGDTISLGPATLTVLGPVKSYPDINNTSLVLMLQYGQTKFLFTGDMESDAEADLLEYWDGDFDFRADVLKVGHHGSNSSSGYRLLDAVQPEYGVISVGAGNDYGHPHQEPLIRLEQAGAVVLRTDELGHIIASSDGREITFTWEKQSAQPDAPAAEALTYIGNRSSRKFHAPGCQNLPSEKNRVEFATYQEALDAGYTPCGNCLK